MSETLDILKDFPPNSHADWMAAVDKQLKGKPFDKALVKKTYEGIDIQPMYFQTDLDGLSQVDTLPGQPPYLRGTAASGSVVHSWMLAQEITLPDPADFNKAVRFDLSKGQNALNIVVDQATCLGLNPDQAETGQVGLGGLSLATLADARTAFEGIDFATYSCRFQCGASGLGITALLAAYLEEKGLSTADLSGAIAVDPLGSLATTGTLSAGLEKSYDQLAQLTHWAVTQAPELKTISVDVQSYQNSGGNAVQDIAYALATGVSYIRALQTRGLDIEQICAHLLFGFAIGADFFMEIAKFRAARMVWSQVVEAFGGSAEAQKMKIHARTSRWNKTEVDPWVNMLRVSTEAFSGIAGGVDSMHVGPFDEIFRTPNEFSRRIARNVHIVLREEGHLDKVVDPAGGCWYVEQLSQQLAEKAWSLFQEIEAQGGMVTALAEGKPQAQVAEVAAKRAKNIATRTDRFVGTNMYPNLQEKRQLAEPFDHAQFQQQRDAAVSQYRKQAESAACTEALNGLPSAMAAMDASLMTGCVKAVAAGATLGDLTQVMQGGGSPLEIQPLSRHRGAEPFEKVRRTTEAYIERTGKTPELFLANMGPIPQHKARADFSTAFFNVGAIGTITNKGFATVDEAAEAALASGAKAVVICSTDATYPDIVPELTGKLKAADPGIMVILAGYPKEHVEAFKEAGVAEFLHMRVNALELITKLQKHLEVIA